MLEGWTGPPDMLALSLPAVLLLMLPLVGFIAPTDPRMLGTVAAIGVSGTVPHPKRKNPAVPTSAMYSKPAATCVASRTPTRSW